MRLRLKVLMLCLLTFTSLFANEELIALYHERMQAEESNDPQKIMLVDKKLAGHYLSESDYKKARFFLENVIANSQEPELTDRKLDVYRLDIIEGDMDKAKSGLISIYFYSAEMEQRSRASYLLGIVNALKGDYERSRKYLKESLVMSNVWDLKLEYSLDSLLADAKKRKKRETAKWLSTFLPGAGQIYAKNAKGAIGAIGIAAFWGGWFVYDLIQQDYYSAALVLLWPWQRYHRGNIQNAEYSVDSYNLMIEDSINKALLKYLSEVEG